jgi:hypothetical protein
MKPRAKQSFVILGDCAEESQLAQPQMPGKLDAAFGSFGDAA